MNSPTAPPSDWIVIFGAAVHPNGEPSVTLRRRIEGAFARAQLLARPVFLPTGGTGVWGPAEAIVMRDRLLQLGAVENQIILEDKSDDTLSSVLNCAAILRRQPSFGRIFVCTSVYHVPRCLVLFRMVGIRASSISVSDDRAALGWRKWIYLRLREIAALPYDVAILAGRLLVGRLGGDTRPKNQSDA
jgi:uncharacterized SAM-binding protein YcdF (DUF218 family)